MLPVCDTPSTFGGGGLVTGDILTAGFDPGTGLPLQNGAPCWPNTWPTDGREGGVPDPTTAGPPIIQIGAEGGLLPSPVVIPSTPVNYEYNRRSITVLNIFNHGLLLGPAERADVVVDFSSVPPGSALILYNDAPAPVPAFDPRTDYYTNNPDYSSTGGAPSTPAGFGPNTRTVMQFTVPAGSTSDNLVKFDFAALQTALPGIFATTQDKIIVPESAYPAGNGFSPVDTYARIQDSQLNFLAGGSLAGIIVGVPGTGYTAAPTVTIPPPGCAAGPGCDPAIAHAVLGGPLQGVTVTNVGRNYTDAPAVTFSAPAGCVDPKCATATGVAVLRPTSVARFTMTNRGSGYTGAPFVIISAPGCDLNGPNCAVATAHATINANTQQVTGVVLDSPGAGYTEAPIVAFWEGGGVDAAATAVLTTTTVASVKIIDGGNGYRVGGTTPPATISFAGGGGNQAAARVNVIPSGGVFAIQLDNPGGGYTSLPDITLTGGTGGSGATAFAQGTGHDMLRKTIQELFTLDYGRMNATLGVELPLTNFFTQTTIPYGYVDPPTEIFKDGETQFWKITHNGVDTHAIHFHLFRAGDQPGGLGRDDQAARSERVGLEGHRPHEPAGGHRRRPPAVPADSPLGRCPNSIRPLDVTSRWAVHRPIQFTNVDPTEPAGRGRNDHDQLRLGIRLALPHPGPRRERHDAGDEPGGRSATAHAGDLGPGRLQQQPVHHHQVGGGPHLRDCLHRPVLARRRALDELATLAGNVGTFLDSGLTRGLTYQYRVIAHNTVGYSQSYAAPAVGYPTANMDSAPAPGPVVRLQ